MDLRAAAGRQARAALRGITARFPSPGGDDGAAARILIRVILHQGARLELPEDGALHEALLAAAGQPEADRAAFCAATAILLANRLQDGLGTEDLGSYWERFQPAYLTLPAHDRAAIIHGFLTGAEIGHVAIQPPESRFAQLTRRSEEVRAALLSAAAVRQGYLLAAATDFAGSQLTALILPQLRMLLAGARQKPLTGDSLLFDPLLSLAANAGHPANLPATAVLLSEAVKVRDEEGWFALTLWPEMIRSWLGLDTISARPIFAGLRYLYEADPLWLPMPDLRASPQRMTGVPYLPVIDESFSGGPPGAHTG